MSKVSTAPAGKTAEYKDKEKPTEIRYSNITAAKGASWLSRIRHFPSLKLPKVDHQKNRRIEFNRCINVHL